VTDFVFLSLASSMGGWAFGLVVGVVKLCVVLRGWWLEVRGSGVKGQGFRGSGVRGQGVRGQRAGCQGSEGRGSGVTGQGFRGSGIRGQEFRGHR
jgi:hypothetical protein